MSDFNICMSCGSKVGDDIYMSSVDLNGLFKYSLTMRTLEYITPFLEEIPSYALYNKSFHFKDEIWFIPQHGRHISIYNLYSRKLDYLNLPLDNIRKLAIDNLNIVSLSSGRIDDSHIFVLPAGIDAILLVDMENRIIESINDAVEGEEFISSGVYHNGRIYGFINNKNLRIEIDLESKKIERKSWKYGKIIDAAWDNQNEFYILSGYETNLCMLCNEKFEPIREIRYMETEDAPKYRGKIFMNNTHRFIMPWHSCFAEKINVLKGTSERFVIKKIDDDKQYIEKVEADELIGFSQGDNNLLFWDNNTNTWQIEKLACDLYQVFDVAKKYRKRFDQIFWSDSMSVIREDYISLDSYLKLILN